MEEYELKEYKLKEYELKENELKKFEIAVNNIVMRKYSDAWWVDIRLYDEKMFTFKDLVQTYNNIFRMPYNCNNINWEYVEEDLGKNVDLKYAAARCNLEYVYLDRIVNRFNNDYIGAIDLYIDIKNGINTTKIKNWDYSEWLSGRYVFVHHAPVFVKWMTYNKNDKIEGVWLGCKEEKNDNMNLFDEPHWCARNQNINATPTEDEERKYIANCMMKCSLCSKYDSCRHKFPFPESSNECIYKDTQYLEYIKSNYNYSCEKYDCESNSDPGKSENSDLFEF